jgi:16S rRNA G966 N2-methylase RsmD
VIDLRNVDCREGFATIPDESIDVIFTDPPYTREYLDCYRVLGKEAARVLKPSGFLVAYAGQTHLPAVIGMLESETLKWFWIAGLLQNSAGCVLWQRNVCSLWKPALIFQKWPVKRCRRQMIDLVGGKWLPKKHPWEQSIEVAIRILGSLAGPGAQVLDPFAGTGSFLVAARALEMDAIGFEIDPDTYHMAREKLEQETLAGRAVAEVSP